MISTLEIEHQVQQRQSHVKQETLLFDGQIIYKFLEGEIQLYNDDFSQAACFNFD